MAKNPTPNSRPDLKPGKKNISIQQIARDAVHGGPKDVKKDKRMGVGRGQKG